MRTPCFDGFASRSDAAACGATLRGGSRTFFAASLALPPRIRRSAIALYAFCRTADDAIDGGGEHAAAHAQLQRRLECVYAGKPLAVAADRAFADCVDRHAIPQYLPAALLEGFAWDAAGRRYANFDALQAYAVRVAGTVGVMMALVMGVREPALLSRACDLGVAMQLTNIARDIGEDARARRLYLPLDWLREAGIDPDELLARPAFSAALAGVVERLLLAADRLYRRGEIGIARLPPACRPAMFAARFLYAEIGNELRRRGCDSVSGRAVVSATRKTFVLASAAIGKRPRVPAAERYRTLPEAAFLLRAFAKGDNLVLPAVRRRDTQRGFKTRVVWLIDLFERLERAERGAAGG